LRPTNSVPADPSDGRSGRAHVRTALRRFWERYAIPLDVAMAALAVVYVVVGEFNDGLFGYKATPATIGLELIVTGIFLLEYVTRLYAAEDRWHFVRTHVIELLALVSTLRLVRGLRLLRLLRLARLAAFTQAFARLYRATDSFDRALSVPLVAYGILGLTGLIFFGALALLVFEKGSNPQVTDFSSAFWLATSIVFTIGLSSAKPQSPEGRIVSGLLVLGGLTSISLFSSAMALHLQRRERDAQEARLERIESLLVELNGRLREAARDEARPLGHG
jgi:voltage-gated potassium channel